jgi:hypothetical protein
MTEQELAAANAGKQSKKKTVKEIKVESEQASSLDLDMTAKFEEGRQIAIAEGRAVLSGYWQGRLEVADFLKAEIMSKPIKMQAASYALSPASDEESRKSLTALLYGTDYEVVDHG